MVFSSILKEENSSDIAAKTTKVNGTFSREDNSTFCTLKGKEFAPIGKNSLLWSRLLLKGLPPSRNQTGSLEISRKNPLRSIHTQQFTCLYFISVSLWCLSVCFWI